jgi:hypothetical protein
MGLLQETLQQEMQHIDPARSALFDHLRNLPSSDLDAELLTKLYINYQAMMHVTRVGIYHATEFAASPEQRGKLYAIIGDDDASEKTSHHEQLKAYFLEIGALPVIRDIPFESIPDMLANETIQHYLVHIKKILVRFSLSKIMQMVGCVHCLMRFLSISRTKQETLLTLEKCLTQA